MASLDEINDDEGDNIPPIPDGFPGSRRKPIYDKPETINIPKRRGRPPGSTNTRSKATINTGAEKMWGEGAAILLGSASTIFAIKIMQNRKYIMTEAEAKSAASGLIYCLFQYKIIREFAIKTKLDTPWAVAFKGFWPYLSRVFLEDIINYVILGLTKQPEPRTKQTGNAGSNSNGNAKSNGPDAGNGNSWYGNSIADNIIVRPDWRNAE